MSNPILHSIKSTGEILGIGRTSIYGLLAEKKIDQIKIGRRTLITNQSILRFVDELKSQISSENIG
jgi:hypothetical protein